MSRASWLLALVRLIRRMPRPRIDRDDAVRRATDEMRRHGWDRDANAPVIEGLRKWVVYGVDALPCGNIAVHVDMQDGSVATYTQEGRAVADSSSESDCR
jgi:hypothetical protein